MRISNILILNIHIVYVCKWSQFSLFIFSHTVPKHKAFLQDNGNIPLPPLPAAMDKDPDALKDTRPPKPVTPPPVHQKTEMEMMIEKHQHSVPPPTVAPPPAPAAMAYGNPYGAYGNAYAQPQQNPHGIPPAAPGEYHVPWNGGSEPPLPPEPHPIDKAKAAAAEVQQKKAAAASAVEDDKPDADELAMLGIDPDDLSGFGGK